MLVTLQKIKPDLCENLDSLDLHSSSVERKLKPSKDWGGAVLMLIARDHLLFIQRSDSMPTHKGQMGFFGGHKNPGETPIETALREFSEETSLELNIDVQGILPVVYTARMQQILPVLGYVDLDADELVKTAVSNGEWTNCIAAPIEHLVKINNWNYGNRFTEDLQGEILFNTLFQHQVISQKPLEKNALLWGASARMTWNFLNLYIKVRQN